MLAIIPARGGSKGLPRKNILLMNRKPLIYYTIKRALESRCLDEIVVSTDDKEIKSLSKKFGSKVVDRPEEFAKDKSPTIDAIRHVIKTLKKEGKTFDIILLLEPTSPLRKKDDIDKSIRSFVDNYTKADALVSLGEIALESPFISKIIKKGFVSPLIRSDKKVFQRQQLPKTYFPYGVVYMAKTKALLKTGTFYQRKTLPYIIERWQNYEVDDFYDFLSVETIMKNRKGDF